MNAEKLLELVPMLARVPVFLSIQETRDPGMSLTWYVCHGSKLGLATLLVLDQFCKIERSWRFKEGCAGVLFGTTLEMAVYAPHCAKRPGDA